MSRTVTGFVSVPVGWRVYYGDGSVSSSDSTPVCQLKRTGAVIVVQYYSDGRKDLFESADWWWWDASRWHRVKMHPKPGEWAELPIDLRAETVVLQGMPIDDDVFEQIEYKAARTQWP